MDRGKKAYRTNYPQQGMLVHGSLLNSIGSTLNASIPPICASDMTGSFANMFLGDKPKIVGVAQITDDGDTGAVVRGERQAPAASFNKYLCKFRYFDATTFGYLNLDTELRIDSSIYHDLALTGGQIPVFKVGDAVAAVYDPVSMWCWPLMGPMPTENVISLAGNQLMELPRGGSPVKAQQYGYNNAQFFLECSSNAGWTPYLLGFAQPTEADGLNTMTATVILRVQHYNNLRIVGGVSKSSRAILTAGPRAVRLQWLGRISGGMASANAAPVSKTQTADMQVLNWSGIDSRTFGRTRDVPTITLFGGTYLRVEMSQPGDEWLVAVTVTVNTTLASLPNLIKLKKLNDDSDNTPVADGKLVEPNDDGYHRGVLIRDINGGEHDDERDMSCYLTFVDHRINSEARNIIAEQGMIYGPAQFVGVQDDGKPLYAMNITKEEYEGRTTTESGTAAKGAEENFELYNGDGTRSGIFRRATLRWNAYKRGKMAMIWRLNGALVANQIECGTT